MPKGRNKTFIERRDEALLRRYYYWTEVERLRFDDALRILSLQEFFLSEERIMAIIRKKCDKLKEVALKPVPKVRKPRLTATQLSLFTDEQFYEENRSPSHLAWPTRREARTKRPSRKP